MKKFEEMTTEEKKVFDVMQKNNLDLMEKLNRAEEVLRFYAYADIHKYHHDKGDSARNFLKEIEK